MIKPSIPLAIAAAVLLTASACERTEVKEEAKDVEKAAEKVEKTEAELEKAKGELRQEEAELAIETQTALNEAEKRFGTLDEQAQTAINALQAAGSDMSQGLAAELTQAQMMAKAKIEALKMAETPEGIKEALKEVDQALEKLDKKLNEYKNEA